MEAEDQVKAYAQADFSEPHDQFIQHIQQCLPAGFLPDNALELGCGPGDITRRFARVFPTCTIDAIDGSQAMLDYAQVALPIELQPRINYCLGRIPDYQPRLATYQLIFSNSLLHHLPDPAVLWRTIRACTGPGSRVFIMDLLRPSSETAAVELVEFYAADEPEILQRDFYHSLLAAFTLAEIQQQLQAAALPFNVIQVSDRHVFISGNL